MQTAVSPTWTGSLPRVRDAGRFIYLFLWLSAAGRGLGGLAKAACPEPSSGMVEGGEVRGSRCMSELTARGSAILTLGFEARTPSNPIFRAQVSPRSLAHTHCVRGTPIFMPGKAELPLKLVSLHPLFPVVIQTSHREPCSWLCFAQWEASMKTQPTH